ncbi:unnamed protein product [Urochloa decumbens]|uniref:AAA+ ATPase domain-containing protein n=1 Tax=Urochloa decumbens TaxID=240449 RepID=A0ABC9GWT5_9POAL
MDLSSVLASPSYGKAAETYKKAVTVAAAAAGYAVVARTMARELLPDEVRSAARWAASVVRDRILPRPKQRRVKTLYIGRASELSGHGDNRLFWDARAYLATRIDPRAEGPLIVATGAGGGGAAQPQAPLLLSMVPGGSATDAFLGVEFTWRLVTVSRRDKDDGDGGRPSALALTFDAEHTDVALGEYLPFIMAAAEAQRRQDTALKIFMNTGWSWHGISHHHPATFDTVAMDPALKNAVVADLDRFIKRREYYRRIGKAWKRGYLLYGPPGTGKSSLVAAMANYLRFNLYDLDPSHVPSNSDLQRLLLGMAKSILVVEDIDCCFTAKSRESVAQYPYITYDDADDAEDDDASDSSQDPKPKIACVSGAPTKEEGITLSGLLNFIDGLWSTSGEERIIIFTTNYKDRLDPALLRPGRMDMHIYMGYCCWEAFKTLAKNYFLVDDHALFPEIQELLEKVEVTPAEVSEMLLRSEDADVALQGLVEFLQDKEEGTKP